MKYLQGKNTAQTFNSEDNLIVLHADNPVGTRNVVIVIINGIRKRICINKNEWKQYTSNEIKYQIEYIKRQKNKRIYIIFHFSSSIKIL